MKEGSKVRILADNRIGVVEDQLFFTLGCKKHLRVLVGQLRGEKCPIWIDRELVTEKMTEKITVSFKSDDGHELDINIVTEYKKGVSRCSVDGEENCNLLMKSSLKVAYLARQFMMSLAGPSNKD